MPVIFVDHGEEKRKFDQNQSKSKENDQKWLTLTESGDILKAPEEVNEQNASIWTIRDYYE